MSGRAAIILLCCAAAATSACGSVSTDAQRSSLAALNRQEAGSVAPHTPPTKDDLPDPKAYCEPLPTPRVGTLPRAGRMPAGSYMERIQARGELVVGVDQNTLGLGYYNPITGQMEGFEIDLVREIARAIFGSPRKIRYTAISTKQRKAAVVKKDVDLVASSFSITCTRRQAMLFSSVYYRSQMRLLVPKAPRVSGLADLRGRLVCVTSDSTTLGRLTELQPATGIEIYVVPLRSDCLVALQEGDVEAIASDDAILFGLRKQDPQTEIVGPGLNCEQWGMAIHRDHPEFVDFVNTVLQRVRRNGVAGDSRRRWLQDLEPPDVAEPCA